MEQSCTSFSGRGPRPTVGKLAESEKMQTKDHNVDSLTMADQQPFLFFNLPLFTIIYWPSGQLVSHGCGFHRGGSGNIRQNS